MKHTIRFPDTPFEPLQLEAGAPLWQVLTARNSPVLFGCRTGICGTCLCQVDDGGALAPPDEEEAETLDVFAPGETGVRLACQLDLQADIDLRMWQ